MGIEKALLTLFMAISGGDDWAVFLSGVESIGTAYKGLFIAYVLFMTVAVLNVMTALFVEASMEAGQNDGETVVHEAVADQAANGNSLQRLFFGDDEASA